MPHPRNSPAAGTAPILDLYAGAGGWDVGAAMLGLPTVGLEIEHDPCVTAVRAGHPRVRCDVATYPTAPFAGRIAGLVASPPCQAWSMAGKRLGEQDKTRVHHLVDRYAAGDYRHAGQWADPRSHHAAQPVRWVRDLRPAFVCLEQVTPVLGLWRHIGDVLRGWGYSVSVRVLCAADYGVPQTRERAILVATRDRPALMPDATHEEDPQASLFEDRLPWVSMADALGWASGLETISNYGTNGDLANRGRRTSTQPASTVTSKAGRTKVVESGWTLDRRTNSCGPRGTTVPVAPVPVDRPAPTLTAVGNQAWVMRNNNTENACVRPIDQPAGTIYFGHRANAVTFDNGEESRRVTVTEAAILQSFPADYPWHGAKTSQFGQVGNAIPPRLAAAVIGAATGADWQAAVTRSYARPETAA